jgi:hypothetical protein
MTDVQFHLASGDVVPTSSDGATAVLQGEFKPWRVRWNGLDRGAPYVRRGDHVAPLVRHGGSYKLPPDRTSAKGYAGDVVLYADPECTRPLRPQLLVKPANLSPEEFAEILADLRSLAFAVSHYLSPDKQLSSRASKPEMRSSLDEWIAAARAAIECLNVYERQLPRIRANPVRTMRLAVKRMTRERALRIGKAHHVQRWPPHVTRVAVPAPVYNTDTPEARFVAATLQRLTTEAKAIKTQLERYAQSAEEVARETDDASVGGIDMCREGPTGWSGASLAESRRLVGEFALVENALGQRGRAPASESPGPRGPLRVRSEDMLIRTNKLVASAEYGPVTRAWETYRRQVQVPEAHAELIARIDESSIANTSLLYERWVTVKIYTALVERGFLPPPGEPSLLDVLAVADKTITLHNANGAALRLVKVCDGERVVLALRHEPQIWAGDGSEYRVPDLLVEARVTGRGRQRTETWVFDAKYKDYSRPAPSYQQKRARGYDSHFLADLVGVAEVWYRQWIRPPANLAVIVHPDNRPAYTYWDQSQVEGRPAGCRAPTPHALLAVPVRSNAWGDANVKKLLRLLLGYRMGLTSTCWQCGSDGERREVPSRGQAYGCEGCGSSWVVTRCFRCGHDPLLKFGRASFHRLESPHDPYNVHCPNCGDHF